MHTTWKLPNGTFTLLKPWSLATERKLDCMALLPSSLIFMRLRCYLRWLIYCSCSSDNLFFSSSSFLARAKAFFYSFSARTLFSICSFNSIFRFFSDSLNLSTYSAFLSKSLKKSSEFKSIRSLLSSIRLIICSVSKLLV